MAARGTTDMTADRFVSKSRQMSRSSNSVKNLKPSARRMTRADQSRQVDAVKNSVIKGPDKGDG